MASFLLKMHMFYSTPFIQSAVWKSFPCIRWL